MLVSQHNFFSDNDREEIEFSVSTVSVTVRNPCCIVTVDGSGVICGLF